MGRAHYRKSGNPTFQKNFLKDHSQKWSKNLTISRHKHNDELKYLQSDSVAKQKNFDLQVPCLNFGVRIWPQFLSIHNASLCTVLLQQFFLHGAK